MTPWLDIKNNINHSPHVVIIGAGASKAALPKGDAAGRLVPVMDELIACLGLAPELHRYGIDSNAMGFEQLYSEIASSNKHAKLKTDIENRIRDYFSCLRLPPGATLYDCLVLSLREKDLIASFNWDPFLAQAWIRNRGYAALPRIVFLHGNVAVGRCRQHRTINVLGQRCNICGALVEPTPLLYPIAKKNYSADTLIANEWAILRSYLRRAYLLTIFGYAAPESDVEAKKLMLSVWKDNPTFELAEVEIVDVKPRTSLRRTWTPFLCREHFAVWKSYRQSYLYSHPRRSCEAFAMATLQCAPWQQNTLPRFRRLERLREWTSVLWREETTGTLSGRTCADQVRDVREARDASQNCLPARSTSERQGQNAASRRAQNMPAQFRFLVMCRFPVVDHDSRVSLAHIVDTIHLPDREYPCVLELCAGIGAVLVESMEGKALDLMAWRLNKAGEREKLDGYVGTPLLLPKGIGAVTLPYQIKVPVKEAGIYGFDLFDRDGVFGKRAGVLATYLYGVMDLCHLPANPSPGFGTGEARVKAANSQHAG